MAALSASLSLNLSKKLGLAIDIWVLFLCLGKSRDLEKQETIVVSRSGAEAEFRALALGICEGMWIQRLLSELGASSEEPIKMFCDNQAAIIIANNPVHHDRTKHIEKDRHFISEKIEKAIVLLVYTPTRSQTADILTKALPRTNFEELSHKLCMYNIYNSA